MYLLRGCCHSCHFLQPLANSDEDLDDRSSADNTTCPREDLLYIALHYIRVETTQPIDLRMIEIPQTENKGKTLSSWGLWVIARKRLLQIEWVHDCISLNDLLGLLLVTDSLSY